MTLDLAARITAARPWPDGAPISSPAPVLLICSEDNDSVIKSRLSSAGADFDRVFLWPRHGGEQLPSFPRDGHLLDAALMRTGAKFVVIDPLMAFLDRSVMSSSDASARRALQPLARLADKHGCVILMVRHLSKAFAGRALYRGGGSIGFIAACRLGWLAAADPCQPGCYVLAQTKNNYAARQTTLSYAFAEGAPRIDWLGPTSWTADELTARSAKATRRRACDFLRRFLADGPRTTTEVWSAGVKVGLTRRTLYRAREDLSVLAVRSREGEKPISTWYFAGQNPKVPVPISETPALDAWLDQLCEAYTPANPLEDFDHLDAQMGAEKMANWEEENAAKRTG